MPIRRSEASELDRILTAELEALRPEALTLASKIKARNISTASLHGIIGGKNNQFVDAVRTEFSDPKSFIASWVGGLIKRITEIERSQQRLEGYVDRDSNARHIARFLKDPVGKQYAFTFLKRNFYRQFNARIRYKPPDNLWSVWFGPNGLTYGLLIAPVFRGVEWTNDKSAMRRAAYVYWTVGHVLASGLVAPDEAKPLTFPNVEALLTFYRFFLKKVANSQYEKGIADRYMAYLEESVDPLSEPFLVPEFRYAGLQEKHHHRLDYTVFNAHTKKLTGFELSPHSTHGAIKGMRQKSQAAVNREQAEKWEKEMTKRNDYFASYKIPIVTFTDKALSSLDDCFSTMQSYLSARPEQPTNLATMLERLDQLEA